MTPIQSAARIFSGIFENGGTVRQKAIRGTVWLLISRWIAKPIQFIQTIILVRLLAPSDFGIMGLLFVITGTIDIFVAPGMQSALIQRKEVDNRSLDTAWIVSIMGALSKSVLLFFAAPYAAAFYNTPILENILKLVAVTYFIGGFRNIGMVLYRRDIDIRTLTIADQLNQLLKAIVTVGLAFWLRSVWALVFGYILGEIFSLLISYWISSYRPSFKFDRTIARGLFRFGRHIFLSGIIMFIISQGDRALVGKVLDLDALGYYTLAFALAVLPSTLLLGVVGQVAFPSFSRVHESPASLRAGYLTIMKFISLVTIPASVGIFLLAPEIVGVVYGAKWLPMVDSLRVLCILGMIRTISGVNVALFRGTGRPEYWTYASAAQMAMMAVLIYPLTVKHGILGTSISVALPLVLIQVWSFKKACEIIRERFSVVLKALRPSLIGMLVMIVVLALVKYLIVDTNSLAWLIGMVFLGAAVYLGAILLVNRGIIAEARSLLKSIG